MTADIHQMARDGRKPRAGPPPQPAAAGPRRVPGRLLAVVLLLLVVLATPLWVALRWPTAAELLLNGGLLLLLACAPASAGARGARPGRTSALGMIALALGAAFCLARLDGLGFRPVLFSIELLCKLGGLLFLGFALGRSERRARVRPVSAGALLGTTFDSVCEPIVVVDSGCRVRLANSYAHQRFSGTLLGLLACETPYFRRDACHGCPVGECFASGAPRFFTVRDQACKPRYEVSAMLVEEGGGAETLQVQRVSEVSARTQTEERLRFLGEAVASLDDAVLGLDPAARVTALNPRCRELFGLDEAQAVGRRLVDVIRCADESGRRELERALARAGSARFDADLLAGAGRLLRTVVSVAPVLDDERQPIGMSVIIRDVTESRRVEEALRQSEKMSSLGAFVAGLVHELNNPLSAIHGAAEALCRARLGGAPAAARLEDLFRHAERCRRIVDGLLRFSRKSSGAQQATDLNQVVADTVELFGRSLAREGIALRVRAEASLPALWACASQLQQVLVNLISNARDSIAAAGRGGTIALTTGRAQESCILEVEDDGAGIAPEALDRVFEAFFTTKEEGRGVGLGLAISRAIVAEHGGVLEAVPRPRRGALFRVVLPLCAAGRARPPAEPTAPLAAGRKRVLVVDDEPAVASSLRERLEALGHEVRAVGGGRAALDLLKRDREFDLVLCDVCMPDLSGVDLYRAVAAAAPAYRGRFVFVTGDMLDEDLALAHGNRVLFKPFNGDQLELLVADAAASPA